MTSAFLLPFLGHFVLVAVLYAALTIARQKSMMRGEASLEDFARAHGDPPHAARIARNLSNQFEAPLFAYFAAAVLLWAGKVDWLDVGLAWLFLLGRVIHTLVQTLGDNVRLRGQVFVINFLAICGLMGHLAWLVLSGGLP